MNYRNEWLQDCFGSGSAAPVIAYFNNGHEPAEYTRNIMQYLVTDPTIKTIVDGLTGEIIYNKQEVNTMFKVFDLIPNDSHKSFYGKAKVIVFEDGTQVLQSYETFVAQKDPDGTIKRLWGGYSRTTQRHINAFCGMNKAEFYAIPREGDITPKEKAAAYSGTLYY